MKKTKGEYSEKKLKKSFVCFSVSKLGLRESTVKGYSPFRGNASSGTFHRMITVAFLLFLTAAGGSNPAGPIT